MDILKKCFLLILFLGVIFDVQAQETKGQSAEDCIRRLILRTLEMNGKNPENYSGIHLKLLEPSDRYSLRYTDTTSEGIVRRLYGKDVQYTFNISYYDSLNDLNASFHGWIYATVDKIDYIEGDSIYKKDFECNLKEPPLGMDVYCIENKTRTSFVLKDEIGVELLNQEVRNKCRNKAVGSF